MRGRWPALRLAGCFCFPVLCAVCGTKRVRALRCGATGRRGRRRRRVVWLPRPGGRRVAAVQGRTVQGMRGRPRSRRVGRWRMLGCVAGLLPRTARPFHVHAASARGGGEARVAVGWRGVSLGRPLVSALGGSGLSQLPKFESKYFQIHVTSKYTRATRGGRGSARWRRPGPGERAHRTVTKRVRVSKSFSCAHAQLRAG